MNMISLVLKSLFLSLVMSVSAFAATVNINTADVPTLAAELTGIGPAKAQAIVVWREANGPFRSVDQLVEVKGIGLATLEKNRDRIEIGTPKTESEAVAKEDAATPSE